MLSDRIYKSIKNLYCEIKISFILISGHIFRVACICKGFRVFWAGLVVPSLGAYKALRGLGSIVPDN